MNEFRWLHLLRDRLVWLVAAALLGALAAALVDRLLPSSYTAVATVLVQGGVREPSAVATSSAGERATPSPTELATQMSLARSERVARRAVAALRYDDTAADSAADTARAIEAAAGSGLPLAGAQQASDDGAAAELLRHIEVWPDAAQSEVFRIAARAADAHEAAHLANVFAAVYLQTAGELRAPGPPAGQLRERSQVARALPSGWSRSAVADGTVREAVPSAAALQAANLTPAGKGGVPAPQSPAAGEVRLLSAALPPAEASGPRLTLTAPLAALGAVLLAALAALLLEAGAPRMRVARDFEALQLPHLVTLQRARWKADPRGASPLTRQQPQARHQEPLRTAHGGLR